MHPMFELVEVGQSQSLLVKRFEIPRFDIPYHFHPEIEIVFFLKGTGKLYIRNSIASFQAGDLFLLGANVPHLFTNQAKRSAGAPPIELLLIQFHATFAQQPLLQFPEFHQLVQLLQKASAGIKWPSMSHPDFAGQLRALAHESGLQRLLAMLHLLDQWSGHQPMELIDKLHPDATPPHTPERIQLVQRFLLQQYHRSITLAEVAELASMNKTSFCRYFKECTRKTFSQYLNELRIDYACKLLLEGTFSVSRIGYEVGYNNVPYFLRQFKKIKGLSPKQYRNQHRGDAA